MYTLWIIFFWDFKFDWSILLLSKTHPNYNIIIAMEIILCAMWKTNAVKTNGMFPARRDVSTV